MKRQNAPKGRSWPALRWAWLLLLPAALVLGTLAASSSFVRAQGGPGPAVEDEALGDDEQMRRQVMERIRVLRAIKLTEALELDDETGKKLFAILDKYDEKILGTHQEMRKAQKRLKKAMRSDATDDEINRRLDEVIKLRKRIDALRYERFEKASAVLDARRRVRLMRVLPRFEREVRKTIREASGEHRRKKRRRGGGRPR